MNSNLDAALRYATEFGWYVYPTPRKGGPAHVKWGTESSRDPAVIRQWWAKWPQALICLNCGASGIAAIDCDVKDGKDGIGVLRRVRDLNGPIPKTLTQRTPSGGLHLIFHGIIKTTQSVIGDGIDTRGVGGMIVLAPSAGYTMSDRPIATLPQWLADLAGRIVNHPEQSQDPVIELDLPGNVAWATDFVKTCAPSIQYQGGEKHLFRIAAVLKDRGIGESTAVDLLFRYFNDRCQPPWDGIDGRTEDRLDVKVHNAWLYLKSVRPGERTAAADFANDVEEPWTDPQPHPTAVKARNECQIDGQTFPVVRDPPRQSKPRSAP